MKKSFLILLPLLLAGCGESEAANNITPTPVPEEQQQENPDHVHTFSSIWNFDDTQHWHSATCEHVSQKSDLGNHVDEDKNYHCDVCDAETYVSVKELYIKKQPNKTTYYVGDVFDPTGMEVNIDFKDGTYVKTTEYSYSHEPLKLSDKEIVISWKQFTKSISINVIEKQAIEDEYTAVIDFHSTTYASKFPEGTNIDTAEKFEELLEYIDEQLDYYDLINEITLVKGQSRKVNSVTYLQIGTRSGEGSLTWSCKEKIYSIEIKAMAYSKYNDNSGVWNVDREAHLNVAGTDYSLEVPTGEPTIISLGPVNFASGTTNFTIASSGGRVLISEMKITWRG